MIPNETHSLRRVILQRLRQLDIAIMPAQTYVYIFRPCDSNRGIPIFHPVNHT
jgi:hypothetical protein